MKRLSVILVASTATLLLSAAATRNPRLADARSLHRRAEATRLRAHFDWSIESFAREMSRS
ncbi:MAG TPA: hypothetical protein VK481_09375 [Gemmatimonadaceae bacterium]|nr:hypothetical protein [Gemmatimonadaceae bacterium]